MTRFIRRLPCVLLLFSLIGCNGGARSSEEEVPQKYAGLPGQTAAVMVWADWRTRTEYNQVQLDLARLVQGYLIEAQKAQEKESKKATPAQFVNPASVIRYQREHPEIEGLRIEQIAPRLGVSRVIYVELQEFSAQSAESFMMLKGKAVATLRVAEVVAGKANILLEEKDITVLFPPKHPEGVPESDKVNVRTIYEGTLTALAQKITQRFGEEKD